MDATGDAAGPDSEAVRAWSKIEAKLHEVAAETGFSKESIHWIWWVIVSPPTPAKETGEPPRSQNADDVCERVVRTLNDQRPGELDATLDSWGIARSEDLGTIVFGLVAKDLLLAEAGDRASDFDGLFTVERFNAYLAEKGIRRRWLDWPGVRRRLSWTLYAGGIFVVVAGWVDLIPYPYHWIGWLIGMLGWAGLHWTRRRA